MQRLPGDIVLHVGVLCPRCKYQSSFSFGLICYHYFKVKLFLIHDHYLQKQERLNQVQLLLAWIRRQLSLSRMIEKHDETLATFIIGFFYWTRETPVLKGDLI